MKNKFLLILGVIGCFLGLKTAGVWGGLWFIPCLLGGYCFSTGILYSSAVFGGIVWGITIPKSAAGKKASAFSIPAMILGGYGLGCVFLCIVSFSGKALIGILLFVAGYLVSALTLKSSGEKKTASSDNALCLGQIDLFQELDKEIHDAAYFVVAFEGVALFSSTNYCYQIYRYEDYRLGELTTPQEVALVGMYFVQKYHDEFTFKVDMEVIPGEPGQTVVAVGTGGIGVARTSGTRDQRIFRSYIFTKR